VRLSLVTNKGYLLTYLLTYSHGARCWTVAILGTGKWNTVHKYVFMRYVYC